MNQIGTFTAPGKIGFQLGVPLPASPKMYPFAEMPVGASFFVPKKATTMSVAVASAQRETGFKFTVRTVTENGVKGARVWRIA